MDYTDEEGAIQEAMRDPFHVELEHAIWGLVKGGISLSSLTQTVKVIAAKASINEKDTLDEAAGHLCVTRKTLYNILHENHK